MYKLYIIHLNVSWNFTTGVSEQELGSISGILSAAKAHTKTIEVLWDNHSAQSLAIEQKAVDTFQKKFMVCQFGV